MSRADDLDKVAPDDPVNNNSSQKEPKSIPESEPPKSESKKSSGNFQDQVYHVFGHTKSPFSSSLVMPNIFSFAEKDDDEKILLVLRPHWFTNLPWIITALVMLFAPSLLTIVPILTFFPAQYQFVAVVFWYLITFAFAFEKFLSWYFNTFIITNERIIDIDFLNLLSKKFSAARIENIQDVTSKISGFTGTMFDYGHVIFQTAAEVPEIEFEEVPHPDKVIKVFNYLQEEISKK